MTYGKTVRGTGMNGSHGAKKTRERRLKNWKSLAPVERGEKEIKRKKHGN